MGLRVEGSETRVTARVSTQLGHIPASCCWALAQGRFYRHRALGLRVVGWGGGVGNTLAVAVPREGSGTVRVG